MTFNPKFLNTSVVPPPTNPMIIVSKYYKNPSRHIQEEAFYDFGHTERYTHAVSSLNSLFPPLPYPLLNFDAGATTVTTYLLVKNYTFYRKTYISHLPYTLHHYFKILSNHMNFMNVGVLNLFTLHRCFLLNPEPKFQNNRLQSGYIY